MKIRKYLTALFLILLFSCGSRKVEVNKQKVETKELRELVLKLQNDIQSNIRLRKIANKTTIEPIDKDKPSVFNGTSFGNARITIEETEIDSTANVNDKSETKINMAEEKETSIKTKEKDTESKKPNTWFWSGLVFLVAILAIGKWKKWF